MSRRDAHLDATLRHLGAAYYDSLHGRASAADVARARDAVQERLAEQPGARDRPGTGRRDETEGPGHGPAGLAGRCTGGGSVRGSPQPT